MSDMEQLVKAYLTIRNERDRIEAEYEEKDRELKDQMVILEQEMLKGCNAMNVQSLKTQGKRRGDDRARERQCSRLTHEKWGAFPRPSLALSSGKGLWT